ncbi:MAG: glutaredoxin domain-containing protein [Candidatus Micrarchaeota archaeon]
MKKPAEPLVVTLYSVPSCPYCMQAKEFLRQNNVKFGEIDVSSDAAAANRLIEKSGQMGVPVIEVGKRVIVGFDKEALSEALSL